MTEDENKYHLQHYAIIVGISLIYSLITINLISGFRQLPSPLFGGDYYYQLGSIYHTYYSEIADWFKSSSFLGGRPTYSPIYSIIVTIFGRITGLSPMQAMLYINIPFIFLIIFSSYLLFYKLTKSGMFAIIGVLLFFPFTTLPILKYTQLAQFFAIPLFFLSLYLLYEHQSWFRAVVLGVSYGFLALLHPTGLIIGTTFVMLFAVYSVFSHSFDYLLAGEFSQFFGSLFDKRLISNLKLSSIFFIMAFLIGFLIAQVWWFEPIFVHFGKSSARVLEWGFQDFSSTTYQLLFLLQTLTGYFLNLSSPVGLLLSVFGIIGFYLIFTKKKDTESKFILFVFIGALMLTFHYFVTVPLAGTFFAPNYMDFMAFRPAFIMIGLFAALKMYIQSKIGESGVTKSAKYLIYLIVIVILVDAFISYDGWYNSRWNQVGRAPLNPEITALQTYILTNTSINDVFLSTNELSFMINAISGRKAVAFRRGHADTFSVLDDREIATAVILYGNNTEEKKRLIKKYNISFLYYSPYWVESEWYFDKTGKITGAYDPLTVFDTLENRAALEINGVQYLPQNTWLDPSMVGEFYKKVDILYVTPNNYEPREGAIWKEDLDSFLELVWKDDTSGSFLYKIHV